MKTLLLALAATASLSACQQDGNTSSLAANDAAPRRGYYLCGPYNVTVEAVAGAVNDIMTVNGPAGFEFLTEISDDGEAVIFQSAETGTNVWISGLSRYPLRQMIYGVTRTDAGGSEGGHIVDCTVSPAHR